MVETGQRLTVPVWRSGRVGGVLPLTRVGGALGSPGWARGPDIFHRGHYRQIGRVRPELWLQVVGVLVMVVTLVTMMVMLVVVLGTVDLDSPGREPGGRVVVVPGVDGVPVVHGPGPGGRHPPLLLVGGEGGGLVAEHVGSSTLGAGHQ